MAKKLGTVSKIVQKRKKENRI